MEDKCHVCDIEYVVDGETECDFCKVEIADMRVDRGSWRYREP